MAGNSIYDEAILDAKKLRDVAEANARNALIEAVTPRVREMIERQLLGEMPMAGDVDLVSAGEPEMVIDTDEEVILDLDLLQGASEGPHDPGETGIGDDDLLLSKEAVEALLALTEGQPADSTDALTERLDRVKKGVSFAQDLAESSAGNERDGRALLGRLLTKMLHEVKTLHSEAIRIGGRGSDSPSSTLNADIQMVFKEIVNMASKKQMLKESDEMYEIDLSELDLSEDDDEMDMDLDVGDDMGDDMGDEMDVEDDMGEMEGEVEIPADLAQQLLDAIEGQVGGDDMDMDMDMDVEDDMEVEDEDLGENDMVEIDEGMLKRELARMRKSLAEGEGATDPDVLEDFGGAKEDKEVFVDGQDSDLNVHAEVRKLRQKLQNESRKNRALTKTIAGNKQVIAKLRDLNEQMNLFNAKLLYVNKLMNRENVTARHKKAIVETLEKAQTLREVRLLYKGLSEALNKGKKKGSINESARRAGSASRAGGSGGAKSNAGYSDRWAQLAGISEDSK